MKIEITINKNDAQKKKGDLLEKFAKTFLEFQNCEVEREVRRTGTELDLVCKNRNNGKKIIVECKAYDEDANVQADAINKIFTAKKVHKYDEAWLVSTSNYGKEAKGLIEEIEKNIEDEKSFVFFSPEKLIQAFISANLIKDEEIVKQTILDVTKEELDRFGEFVLFITEYGNFWALKHMEGGMAKGLVFCFAGTGKLVIERDLLTNLRLTNSSLKELNFFTIFDFIEEDGGVENTGIAEEFKLNKDYINEINDLGIKLMHPEKDELDLEDVYINPDLADAESETLERIKSDSLLNYSEDVCKCLVFGEDLSGKSSLSKNLQKKFNEKEFIPLYIDAAEIKQSNFDKFASILINNFKKQYSDDKLQINAFKNIINNKGKIVVIIDNFESLGIKRMEAKRQFFETLNDKFDSIFIFANKSIEIEIMADSETKELFDGFKILEIKQLGHVLRDELIEKWLTVGHKETISDEELNNRKIEISKKINIIVGTNFVPTYPLYLLTMLQLIDDDTKMKIQGSSYAELYRYLIDRALGGAGARAEDLDFYHTYLSNLAHCFFVNRVKDLSDEAMLKMYTDYSQKMDIEKNFSYVHQILTKAKLLKSENGGYSFNHNYSYYFFVAMYLAHNLDNPETKQEITNIIARLYRTDNANIVIFFIYHSNNKDIISEIIKESKKIFSDKYPYTLSDAETGLIDKLIYEEIVLSIDDGKPADHRRNDLELQDKIEQDSQKDRNDAQEDADDENNLGLIAKINLSFKLMEILGQIADNYYGSLEGDKKADILEESYFLGFRGLRFLLEDFEKYLDSMKKDILAFIAKKNLPLEVDKERIVNRFIYEFTVMIVLTFVKRVSNSMASKNLFPTVARVLSRNPTPAAKLINMAVRLNFPNDLNVAKIVDLDKEFAKNFLPKEMLRFLVAEHLYKFDVDYKEKQSICDKLKIDMKQSKVLHYKNSQF